ncbi:PepSY domain-containing protein [Sedimenticola sp.]|uniref:PepSY domain-containing protein n=1 Tax=Sedimenticola sp. TaxID=1940285 RepID=UPI003D140907
MMKRLLFITVLLLPLWSAAESDHERAKALRESGEIMPLEQILANIRGEYPGRLLEVSLEQEGKALIYEIELLDNEGKVWELELDAVTGKLIKRKQDD